MAAQQAQRQELAYALITPYSLHKSRTGGIIARLLWANAELVAARMYAPRPESGFIEEYCDAIYDPAEQHVPLPYQARLIDYVLKNFGRPNVRGISNRVTLLLFRGPNAVQEIAEATGHLGQHVQGDNVRGTFGDVFHERPADLLKDPAYGSRHKLMEKYAPLWRHASPEAERDFFEPAALTGRHAGMNERHLKIFRKYAYSDGGFVLDALDDLDPATSQTSMVILKPESFRNRNPLPGNLVDFFARTGMRITAMKMMELSTEEARQFYGLKLPQFRRQLKGMVARKAREIVRKARMLAGEAVERLGADAEAASNPARALEALKRLEEPDRAAGEPGEVKAQVVERIFEELARRLDNLEPPDALYEKLADDLSELNAQAEFDELIRYMTGKDPATGRPLSEGGPARCMVLLYSGREALSAIRTRLKELREVYGQNVLLNRAHASDPEEDPAKEMEVLGMPTAPQGERKPCDVERVINEFYGEA